jgi:hypothetical protein
MLSRENFGQDAQCFDEQKLRASIVALGQMNAGKVADADALLVVPTGGSAIALGWNGPSARSWMESARVSSSSASSLRLRSVSCCARASRAP